MKSLENTFKIQFYDDNDYELIAVTNKPTALINTQSGTAITYGCYDNIYTLYKSFIDNYKANGLLSQANKLALIKLPENQDVIDRIVNDTDYAHSLFANIKINPLFQ